LEPRNVELRGLLLNQGSRDIQQVLRDFLVADLREQRLRFADLVLVVQGLEQQAVIAGLYGRNIFPPAQGDLSQSDLARGAKRFTDHTVSILCEVVCGYQVV